MMLTFTDIFSAGRIGFCALQGPRPEIRNPKTERIPKLETRSENRRAASHSEFGFRTCFGFRISDFGFGAPEPCCPAKNLGNIL